jgi:zinc transport system substrate-binding protein
MLRHTFPLLAAVILLLVIALISGCGKEDTGRPPRLRVLCTFLPVWIMTQNVVGDVEGVQVETLLPPDVSPHHFTLTNKDMKKITSADLMVLNGHDLEIFLGDTLERAAPELRKIDASRTVEPIYFDADENEHEGHEHEHRHGTINPHTWVSPKQAIKMIREIAKGLSEVDPDHADEYNTNAKVYIEKLQELVDEYDKAAKDFKRTEIVTGHHAFEYLARDFGLEIVIVIQAIAEQQPSARQMENIIRQIKDSGATAVFVEPLVSSDISKIIAEETGLRVLVLDPLGTGKMDRHEYLRVMRKNLEELRKALM